MRTIDFDRTLVSYIALERPTAEVRRIVREAGFSRVPQYTSIYGDQLFVHSTVPRYLWEPRAIAANRSFSTPTAPDHEEFA